MCEGMTIHAIGDKASGHVAEGSNQGNDGARSFSRGGEMRSLLTDLLLLRICNALTRDQRR